MSGNFIFRLCFIRKECFNKRTNFLRKDQILQKKCHQGGFRMIFLNYISGGDSHLSSQQPRGPGTAFGCGIQTPALPDLVPMVPGITLLPSLLPMLYGSKLTDCPCLVFSKFSIFPHKDLQLSLQLLYQCLMRGLLPAKTPQNPPLHHHSIPFLERRKHLTDSNVHSREGYV